MMGSKLHSYVFILLSLGLQNAFVHTSTGRVLAQSNDQQAGSTGDAQGLIDLRGRLSVLPGDGSLQKVSLKLQLENLSYVNIILANGSDFSKQEYSSGSQVIVRGTINGNGTAIRTSDYDSITLANTTSTSEVSQYITRGVEPAARGQSPDTSFKVLVIVAKACGNGPSPTNIKDAMGKVKTVWEQCSNGRFKFDMAGSVIVGPVDVGCSFKGATYNFNKGDCPADGWYDAARTTMQAYARSQGYDANDFPHVTYSLPNAGCWPGMGELGCTGNGCWVMLAGWYAEQPYAMQHEWGHNLGLSHAARTGESNEYGDPTDCMGSGEYGCWNLPHQRQMGWTEVTTLSPSNLKQNSAVTLFITPVTRSTTAGLRILTDEYTPGNKDRIYISYLLKEGGNAGLSSEYHDKVVVHTFPEKDVFYDQVQSWGLTMLQVPALSAGDTWTKNGFRVKYLSSGSGAAQVQVCKFSGQPSDCNSFSSGSGGVGQPRPPAPPPPSTPSQAEMTVTLYSQSNLQGSEWQQATFVYNTANSPTCYEVTKLKQSVNNRVRSFKLEIKTTGLSDQQAAALAGKSVLTLYDAPLSTQKSTTGSWAYNRFTCSGTSCRLHQNQMGSTSNRVSALQLCMNGAKATGTTILG